MDAAQGESAKQKFERYARQLGRCILACSLCERGCKMFNVNNTCRIPHFQPTIQHKKYMLIKNRPENKDINGLFSDIIKIINDNGLKKDDFYITTVTKCYGDDDYECPYFALEWDAMKKVPPDVAICFDEKSAISIGAEFKPRKLISMNNYKVFCVENMSDLELFLKVVNQQNRNRQIS